VVGDQDPQIALWLGRPIASYPASHPTSPGKPFAKLDRLLECLSFRQSTPAEEGRRQNVDQEARSNPPSKPKPPKATSKPPQSQLIGNRLRPQSHPKATPKLPQSFHKAPTKLPQSSHKARYKPCAWEGIERCKPGTCVVQARSMRGTLLLSNGALRGAAAAPPDLCLILTALVCPIFKRISILPLLCIIHARAHFARRTSIGEARLAAHITQGQLWTNC
jgi:hypothetical protein